MEGDRTEDFQLNNTHNKFLRHVLSLKEKLNEKDFSLPINFISVEKLSFNI